MKNLELLPLPAESKKRIDEFARQYQRMGTSLLRLYPIMKVA